MSQLMITDLSVTEELGRHAMAAVRGGSGPNGNAWGYYAKMLREEPLAGYVPYNISNNQVAQAGQSIINITGDLTNVTFTNTVTSAGPVTASAGNTF